MTGTEPYSHLTDPLRSKRITASMAGAILSNNPWMTRDDAMRSLVRDALGADREFKGNPPTEWGNANEAGALLEFQMETGLTVTPAKFTVPDDDEGIFGCSPDGWVSDGGGVEQKCPFGIRKDNPPVFKSLAEQPQYFDQCQFSIFVTNRPHWWFSQWTPHGTSREIVHPCQKWRDHALPILRQFHAELVATINDPDLAAEHLAPLRVVIDTPAASKAVREWDEIAEQMELLQERKADLLAQMVDMAGSRDATIAGRKLTLVEKAGSVSYKKALDHYAPKADTSKFMGKSSSYWKMT